MQYVIICYTEITGACDETGTTFWLSVQVLPDQEAAIEAFFQINNWTLVKGSRFHLILYLK